MRVIKAFFGLLLIGVAAVLLLVGPRQRVEPPKDVVVVEYWEKWTGEEGRALKASVDEFNATVGKQKGIYVNLLSTSGIVQKTLVATAGGVPPDLAGLWEANLAQLAALNALEPLDELAARHGITKAKYKKVFWDECHYDDKLYALVSTPYCYAMYYNTRIFRENADKLRAAGCDPNRPPTTMEELDRYAKALDDIAPDGTIRRTGFLPLEPGWDLSFFPYNFGGFWWDADAKKFTFLDPAVVECFTWVQSYSKRLGKGAVAEFRSTAGSYDSPQNPFLSGTTAIVSQGTFFANTIQVQRPSLVGDYAVAPFPTAKPGLKGVSSCTADILCIPKGAKHKEEAFEFIAWLNQRENMEKLCNAHCKISPLVEVSDAFKRNHKNPFIHVFEELASGDGAVRTPSIATLPQTGADLANFSADVAAMRCTPEEGLRIVQERAQARYDDFVAKQKLWKE